MRQEFKQKLFNKIAWGLLEQNEKSSRQQGSSYFYRLHKEAGDGKPARDLKCGIGFIIPDDYYRPIMENRTADALLKDDPLLAGHLGMYHPSRWPEQLDEKTRDEYLREWSNDLEFMRSVQRLHDCNLPDLWPEKLLKLADALDLTVPSIVKQRLAEGMPPPSISPEDKAELDDILKNANN